MDPNKLKHNLDFLLSSYNYEIDSSLIASKPNKVRHKSKMMIVRDLKKSQNYCLNKLTENIVDEINKGDLIIVNDTKVMKARLNVYLENNSSVELLILELIEKSIWLCLAKPAKKLKVNTCLKIRSEFKNDIQLKVIGIHEETGGRLIKFPNDLNNLIAMNRLLDIYGLVPLPPYIKKIDEFYLHEKSYQTEYAKNPGAVAAPTAGLHLSKEIINSLKNKGVKILSITLHVGYGTFKPISQDNLINLKLHKEFANVKKNVIDEINLVKKKGNKVIAIGTTSVRALESCYCSERNQIIPINQKIDLVIKPGFKFRVVDGLLTNFHLPKSSLLLLVSAIIGRERLLDLYKKAIQEKFRFFSYGDAMFITPEAFLEDSKTML